MKKYVFLFFVMLLLFACKNQKAVDDRDTPNKGTIYISVDESFKPVIEEQIKIHHSSCHSRSLT